MKNYVSASVLSADMLNLGSEVLKLKNSGIEMLHFDVMDGIFVNNITFGLPILQQVRKQSDITLDVHLMIKEPAKYIKRFAEAGADIISFHVESDSDPAETLKAIRSCGVSPAVALKPATPAETVFDLLPYLDMVLVMTVEPGFGGQSFIPETVDKIRSIRSKITEMGLDVNVEVDGGINSETAAVVRRAGANVLVSGSYLFHAADMAAAANALKEDMIC
ncbi:ribulose-phosphate 3-epimerase [Ruminococcus sp.]|uniref:ribulose-phosphate 3-epimerase n=1 Tax=Ruminococcus sp. TaxID=41978 RepID=UPI0025DC274E|nr:ribulose-phosphate 3-epimerase [Ruminococcus sp.]